MRVTKSDLERKIDLLNQITNNPEKPYADGYEVVNGINRLKANAGNYHLAGAYGGWELQQMSKGGGTRDVLSSGYTTKKDLYYLICAFIDGIEEGQKVIMENTI